MIFYFYGLNIHEQPSQRGIKLSPEEAISEIALFMPLMDDFKLTIDGIKVRGSAAVV